MNSSLSFCWDMEFGVQAILAVFASAFLLSVAASLIFQYKLLFKKYVKYHVSSHSDCVHVKLCWLHLLLLMTNRSVTVLMAQSKSGGGKKCGH